MIKFYCLIWTKEAIRKPSVFWPKYGSDEDWVCQILNLYVDDKRPYSDKESSYASCGLPS